MYKLAVVAAMAASATAVCTEKPPACAENQLPERKDGCVTCLPTNTCNADTRAACKVTMAADSFPTCTDTTKKGLFDRATCCPTCKFAGAKGKGDKPAKGKCNKDTFKRCMTERPACEEGQTPDFDGTCCKTCLRKKAKQSLARIARCGAKDAVPECGEGEEPQQVTDANGGFDCPTCRPPKPVCENSCTENQRCVRAGKDKTPKCVGKAFKKFKFIAKKAAAKAALAKMTVDEVREALLELAARYCDNPENADVCENNLQALVDGLVVKYANRVNDEADKDAVDEEEIIAEVPESTAGRRLLSASGAGDLLDAAVASNTDADFGIESENEPNSAFSVGFPVAAVATAMAALFTML
jgi:hypothetical protein